MTDHSKICPFCKEAIHIEARKCPRCQQWLGWSRLFVYAPVLLIVLIFLGFSTWERSMRDAMFSSEPFGPHRDQLSIIESRMHYSRDEQCPTISVVGRIRNDSDIPWKQVVIEVRYYDQSGTLIDAKNDQQYNTIVPAHDTAAFVASSRPTRAEAEYATFQVEVMGAHDARGRLF